ncbi:hypothetical protein OsI_01910 [Oryza sativa Indica Group]|uniref:Uncharacterized protein n=1 Tax=Oryza sativa subsp. indica TaxID=39946 RepID=B8A7Z3_ORYSI|nr:hypothetical protein OsI_01910 [Oryza sativa Indica Group]
MAPRSATGSPGPLPRGYRIMFGSLEFEATGEGLLMRLASRTPSMIAITPAPPRAPNLRRRRRLHELRIRMERRVAPRVVLPDWDAHLWLRPAAALQGAHPHQRLPRREHAGKMWPGRRRSHTE